MSHGCMMGVGCWRACVACCMPIMPCCCTDVMSHVPRSERCTLHGHNVARCMHAGPCDAPCRTSQWRAAAVLVSVACNHACCATFRWKPRGCMLHAACCVLHGFCNAHGLCCVSHVSRNLQCILYCLRCTLRVACCPLQRCTPQTAPHRWPRNVLFFLIADITSYTCILQCP